MALLFPNSENNYKSLSNHRTTTDTNPSNDHKDSTTNITKPENDTINIKVTSNNNQIPPVHQTPSLPPLPKQMTTTATVTLCDTRTQTPPGLHKPIKNQKVYIEPIPTQQLILHLWKQSMNQLV